MARGFPQHRLEQDRRRESGDSPGTIPAGVIG